jgi:hypothetical protein
MEKKPSTIDARIRRQQEKLLEALAESGNVSFACKKAGVSRDTYYRWRKEDDDFAHKVVLAIGSGKEFVNDLAHNQLIRNIQNGDMGAIKFQLGNCHEDYHPKKTTPPFRLEDNLRSINISSIPTIVEIERYRQQLEELEKLGWKDDGFTPPPSDERRE